MQEKKIICTECKKQIHSRDELAVVGNAFLPYHEKCFDSIKHSNVYAFYSSYKTNGPFPWVMMVILNIILWAAYFYLNAPYDEVLIFNLLIVAMTLFFRITSYLLYERHLPSGFSGINDKRVK